MNGAVCFQAQQHIEKNMSAALVAAGRGLFLWACNTETTLGPRIASGQRAARLAEGFHRMGGGAFPVEELVRVAAHDALDQVRSVLFVEPAFFHQFA